MEGTRSGTRSEPAVTAAAGSRPPCRFFLLGKCKFGESCTFSHDPRGRLPVCRFFEKHGSCRYGKDCKFLHGDVAGGGSGGGARSSASASNATSRGGGVEDRTVGGEAGGAAATGATQAAEAVQLDAGDNCGICLENIPASGKRFGLLNCDHVYCLECLRTWRKSKGPQKDISRTCPECRKVSFFLVPSKDHLKGKEKAKAMQEYKKGLSKLPCKYHKPNGSTTCPFGGRCFYAHLDENGNDAKDRVPSSSTSRRSCPYLRNGGSGGGRSSSRSGGHSRPPRSMSGASISEEPDWPDVEALVRWGRVSDDTLQDGLLNHLERLMFEVSGR